MSIVAPSNTIGRGEVETLFKSIGTTLESLLEKLQDVCKVERPPQMEGKMMTALLAPKAPVTPVHVELKAEQIRTKPLEIFREAKQAVDLTQAPILVSVGRGIKAPENIPMAEKLARLLGGELAASRPICDEGWLPMDRQIGSSGQTVAPKLYLALGISGAIQHVVGMKGSRTIVAVNKDQNAPIFEVADYGIVGDLFEIVPALIEELEKTKST